MTSVQLLPFLNCHLYVIPFPPVALILNVIFFEGTQIDNFEFGCIEIDIGVHIVVTLSIKPGVL